MRIVAAMLLVLLLSPGAAAADLELALSVNAQTSSTAYRGWPLLVEVLILNASEAEALTLAPRGVAWPRAVKLRATGPDGKDEPLPYELTAEPPGEPLLLPAGASTRFVILVPETATANLSVGRHRLEARLQVGDSPGWNGATGATASFEMRPGHEADAAQRLTGATLRATACALRKEYAAAKTILREHLKREAEPGPVLQLMAEILEVEGDIEAAAVFASRALALAVGERQVYSRESEPPAQLLQLQRRLLGRLLPPGTPQPGTLPPGPAAPASPGRSEPSAPASSRPSTPAAPARPAPVSPPAPGKPSPPAPAPASPAVPPADDAKAKALKQYAETLAKGDALYAAGDYFEAVRVFEQAWRIRYNNKLDVPAADLDERLARARKARDEKKR